MTATVKPPRPTLAAAPPAARQSSSLSAPPLVTVLLIVHLFALGVGLAVNGGNGKSMLSPALVRIPAVRQYLEVLWMNLGYDFHLASPLPEDGAHRLQLMSPAAAAAAAEAERASAQAQYDPDAEQKAADAAALAVVQAELPASALWPRVRAQRYGQLAFHVAYFDELFADNSDLRTQLPLAIAESWLRELAAPPAAYVLRCRREPAPRLPKAIEVAPTRPKEGGSRSSADSVFPPVTILVRLVWDPEQERYEGSRADPASETAGVAQPPAADASGE